MNLNFNGFEALALFVRISAAISVLPIYGSRLVSAKIKVILALSFFAVCVLVMPVTNGKQALTVGLLEIIAVEVCCGLLLGFCVRSFFWIVEISGVLVSNSISVSQMFGVETDNMNTSVSKILVWSSFAVAVSIGFPLVAIDFFASSFYFVPLAVGLSIANIEYLSFAPIRRIFEIAVVLASPFLVFSLLFNLFLGVVNRAMPQLMVAFVGAPAIILIGIFLLLISLPLISGVWISHVTEIDVLWVIYKHE